MVTGNGRKGMFIYVFSNQDKELLLSKGYLLLNEDVEADRYVFAADNSTLEDFDAIVGLQSFYMSNVLTF